MSRFREMSFSQTIDAEFAELERRIVELEDENEELRRKNCELLGKYVAAQDLATARMVQMFLNAPDARELASRMQEK